MASNSSKSVEVCYMWSSGNGLGFSESATGVARKTVGMTIEAFIALVNGSDAVIDLRPRPITAGPSSTT